MVQLQKVTITNRVRTGEYEYIEIVTEDYGENASPKVAFQKMDEALKELEKRQKE
jgi:hypothetical protein